MSKLRPACDTYSIAVHQQVPCGNGGRAFLHKDAISACLVTFLSRHRCRSQGATNASSSNGQSIPRERLMYRLVRCSWYAEYIHCQASSAAIGQDRGKGISPFVAVSHLNWLSVGHFVELRRVTSDNNVANPCRTGKVASQCMHELLPSALATEHGFLMKAG